ncbi:MAG: tetratricopeptide repeat protein [Sandaracinaceae bacterium]
MSRFAGYPSAEGLLVLDTWTGEVVLVRPGDGTHVIRAGVAPGEAPTFTPFPTPTAVGDVVRALAPAPASEPVDPLDRDILNTFPYPVAAVWRTFLDEPDPRQRCKLLVDAFTALLKLWALQVAAEYLASPVRHATVNSTLERDFQRPLISTWNLTLQRTLPVLSDHGVALFSPELRRVYDLIEAECSDRVAVRVPYETKDGERRHRISRLGKVSALIRYRNGLAHGFHQTRDKAEADLETWLPVIRDVFEHARFVARYPLYLTAEGGAYRMAGARPPGRLEPVTPSLPADTRAFLWDPENERALPLPVLVDTDPLESGAEAFEGFRQDLVLFEGTARRSVVYLASADGSRIEKQRALERWRGLLADKHVETRALGRRRLSVAWLQDASARQVRGAIDDLTHHGKYLPSAAVDRPDVAPLFERFEHGRYQGLVLAGEGGVGKTTLLARAAERWRDAGDVVVFLRGASVGRPDLGRRALRELAVGDLFFDDFLELADPLFAEAGVRLRVVLDGIDEHPEDPSALVRSFDGLVEQAADYPWVRLVVSVRTAAYRRSEERAAFRPSPHRRYLLVDDQPIVELGPLPAVLVLVAYEAHRDFMVEGLAGEGLYPFRPETAFEDLDLEGTTVRLLRNPLMLRLLLAAHHRRALPSHLSASDAFEIYLEQAVCEREEGQGGHPERLAFLRAFVGHLDQHDLDADVREALESVPALRPALDNPYRDSAYVALLDLGVLREEWEGDRCTVRFAFQGLLEHLLAERHERAVESADDLLTVARRALVYPSLREALVMMLRRLVRGHRARALAEALDGHAGEDAGSLLRGVTRDLLVVLGRYRDEAFEPLLRRMSETPSNADVDVLLAAEARLFDQGETEAAEATLLAAEAIDDALSFAPARIALASARIAHRRGQIEPALDALRTCADVAKAPLVRAEAALLSAQISVSRGQLEDASTQYTAAREAFERAGQLGPASAAVRGLASVAGRRDQRVEERALIEHAVKLARQAGDAENLGRALNNLGRAHRAAGQNDEAERCYRESIEEKRALGDRVGAASSGLNLGSVLFVGGQLEAAEAAWNDALELALATQHRGAEAFAHLNLSLAHRWRGHPDAGLRHALSALSVFEQKDDPRGLAYALWMCGSNALDAARAGDDASLESAESYESRLRALLDRAPEQKLALYAAILGARRAAALGDEGLIDALSAVHTLDESLDARAWDVEDGPVDAYLEGGLALSESNPEAAERWFREARAALAGRAHPRAAELQSR